MKSSVRWHALIPAVTAGAVCVLAACAGVRRIVFLLVGARPQVRVIRARRVSASQVYLPGSVSARAPVECYLRFGPGLAHTARLGEITDVHADGVTRHFTPLSAPLPSGDSQVLLTGYPPVEHHPLADTIEHITVRSSGRSFPAWFVPAAADTDHWVIHIQGIRTSRAVTLRSMEASVAAGYPTLSVTFRGAGELPHPGTSTLGQREWEDVAAAVDAAGARGARSITLVGWSMGAGIALEVARHRPEIISGLVLICPATHWPDIVRDTLAGMKAPRILYPITRGILRHQATAQLAGAHSPVDLEALNWTQPGTLRVPTLVIHSRGDTTIPFAHSERFAATHGPLVDLQEFPETPHGWEANADTQRFHQLLRAHIARNASVTSRENLTR